MGMRFPAERIEKCQFVPLWLVLPRCEAINWGVFDLCHVTHVDLLKRGDANLGGFGAC